MKTEPQVHMAYRKYFTSTEIGSNGHPHLTFRHHRGKLYKKTSSSTGKWEKSSKSEYVSVVYKIACGKCMAMCTKNNLEGIYYLFMTDDKNGMDPEDCLLVRDLEWAK